MTQPTFSEDAQNRRYQSMMDDHERHQATVLKANPGYRYALRGEGIPEDVEAIYRGKPCRITDSHYVGWFLGFPMTGMSETCEVRYLNNHRTNVQREHLLVKEWHR